LLRLKVELDVTFPSFWPCLCSVSLKRIRNSEKIKIVTRIKKNCEKRRNIENIRKQ
jgi:hypothetical protein